MKIIKLTALFLIVQFSTLFAQNIELNEKHIDTDGKINFAKPTTKIFSNSINEQALIGSILQADKQLQFRLERTAKNDSNTHNYYRFLLQGIAIVGADYVVHSTNGTIDFANGNIPILPGIINAKPGIVIEQARTSLKSQLVEENKNIKGISFEFAVNELVWFYQNKNLTLAYKIETKGKGILLHGNYFVNANTGKLIGFESFICTGHGNKLPPPNAPGTAQTLYSSTQNIITDANFNSGFRLREERNGVNILTLNANYQANSEIIVNGATDFWDNDNNWQTMEHTGDIQAHDAHWASEKVFDYWRTIQNRNSIDGNGIQIRSFVHVNEERNGQLVAMDNAYWNSQKTSIFYGDGNFVFRPVISLDICAHEIGHGVCQFTSNLTYQGESGALNEGFSDIWGATIEAWAAPTKQRWLIAEEVTLLYPNYLRSMSNPNSGLSNQPDTYNGSYWASTSGSSDNGGVHTNSGVLNYWYYLLSDGGSGTNDINNTYTVSGIGLDKAAKIAYRTEQLLNSSANYAMARTMSIQAARDLFGTNSCEEKVVTDAWYAVGVGAAFNGTIAYTPEITGPTELCSSAIYTVELTAGATATWSANALVTISPITSTGSQVSVAKVNSSGTTYLSVNVTTSQTGPCSPPIGSYAGSKQIIIGSSNYYTQTPYWTQNGNTTYMGNCNKITEIVCPPAIAKSSNINGGEANIIDPCAYFTSGYVNDATATSITWSKVGSSVNSHFIWSASGSRFNVSCPTNYPNDWIKLRCTTSNSCGSGFRDYSFYINKKPPMCDIVIVELRTNQNTNDFMKIIVAPNPSTGLFVLTLNTKNKSSVIKEVIIKNKMGALVYQQKFNTNQRSQTINLSNHGTDVYMIQVFDGTEWFTEKLSLRR